MLQSFNFGMNWKAYSSHFFNETHFKHATQSLTDLISPARIQGASFLDIGSGSGIFSLAAKSLGASSVTGVDLSKESIEAAHANLKKIGIHDVIFKQFDILDPSYRDLGTYDIVYSWGVLHHTGDMYTAISHACDLVKEDGVLVIAIYNTHWSSLPWKYIKIFYNVSPHIIKRLLVYVFYAVIFIAKFLVTFKNPLQKERGMSFYYDVIDWLGGYPYEYATKEQIVDFVEKRSFSLTTLRAANVPTGCNEFVFIKNVHPS